MGLEDFADGCTLIGPNSVATVSISDSSKDTKIQFGQTAFIVKENAGVINIPVVRRGHTKGRACVNWTTFDGSATQGLDYLGGSSQLVFDVGEIEKHIDIPIVDDKEFEKHETFEVYLSEPSEGASLSAKKRRCIVTILNDDEMTLLLSQSDKLVEKQLEQLQPGVQSWRQQFIQAANVNGGEIQVTRQLFSVLVAETAIVNTSQNFILEEDLCVHWYFVPLPMWRQAPTGAGQ